jgi:hypothetical protein
MARHKAFLRRSETGKIQIGLACSSGAYVGYAWITSVMGRF